jgi:hypothetical protein
MIPGAILNDGVRDTGCSQKVFRRKAVELLIRFRGMHRYLPALFKHAGLRITEAPVRHRSRRAGVSKYNHWSRGVAGAYDLIEVAWLLSRRLMGVVLFVPVGLGVHFSAPTIAEGSLPAVLLNAAGWMAFLICAALRVQADYRNYCRRTPRSWPRRASFHSPPSVSAELKRLKQDVLRLGRAVAGIKLVSPLAFVGKSHSASSQS